MLATAQRRRRTPLQQPTYQHMKRLQSAYWREGASGKRVIYLGGRLKEEGPRPTGRVQEAITTLSAAQVYKVAVLH
jgi:hypothetical protein